MAIWTITNRRLPPTSVDSQPRYASERLSKMIQAKDLTAQYRDDGNLNARITLHARFSTNPYGWQRWVFDQIKAPESAHFLEVGCGPGGLWTANHQRIRAGWRITLTDLSPGMVRTVAGALKTLDPTIVPVAADAQALPFGGIFDIIIANHMLYHVPDRRRALKEMRRLLKPGGHLYATTVGQAHMHELWALVAPFIPDIHQRASRVSQGFTLENGAAQLAKYFNHPTRYIYDDDLRVTEVEPLIGYLQSSVTLMDCDLAPAQWADLHQNITAQIRKVGAVCIHKASGLFVARKPKEEMGTT